MKKRLSLVLAIVMVAAMMLAALPITAFAEGEEETVVNTVRIGTLELPDLASAIDFAKTPGMFTGDVTITLLTDIEVGGSMTISSPKAEDGITPYKLTIDGNGHTITASAANVFVMGAGAGVKEDIVFKDMDIRFTGLTGAVFHHKAHGSFLYEDMNIVAPQSVQWTLFNANFMNTPDTPYFVTLNDVDMIQPAYGTTLSNGGEGNFMRPGNGGATDSSAYGKYVLNDCDMVVTEAQWAAGAAGATKGIYVTHANATWELNNCTIKSKNSPIYITSVITAPDGTKIVTLNGCKLEMVDPIDPETGKASFPNGLNKDTQQPSKEADARPLIYTDKYAQINGTYVEPTGEAMVVTAEARTPYATLAEAIAAAKTSTVDCTIVLNKDITLAEAITIESANADVQVTFNGGDYTVTATQGNAIKVGATGTAAKIDIKNLNVEYSTGNGSVIQIYANGAVNLTDVKINSTANLNYCAVNALNTGAGTTLNVVIDDCVFVSNAEGAKAGASVIRTGNDDDAVSNVTVKNTIVKVEGTPAANAVAAIGVTDDTSVVVVENCWITGNTTAAISTVAGLATKVQVKSSYIAVADSTPAFSDAAAVEVDQTSTVIEGEAADAPTTDAPATDAPATDAPTTDAPATDAPATDAPATDAPATEAPTTEAPAGGCGGIAIAAQLVALICAAAAVLIIKKK